MDPFLDRVSPELERFTIKPGQVLVYENREVVVVDILSVHKALVNDADTGAIIHADIQRLSPVKESSDPKIGSDTTVKNKHALMDAAAFSDGQWQEAQRRFNIIRPLLALRKRTTADVQAIADQSGFSRALIYNMIRSYEDSESIGSLLPNKRGPKHGGKKIHPAVESIIAEMIDRHYLSDQKTSVAGVHEQIKHACVLRGLSVPAINTVHLRIRRKDIREVVEAREGKDHAKQMFDGKETGVPGADHPLEFVQIDHTQADIIVVDEQFRLPIGRPWITLVIDLCTRVVLGIYLSLESPSYSSVGAALANAILPKHEYLAELDLNVEWPVWGVPTRIGADNGSDFTSNYLEKSTANYPFIIEWRPLDDTHFGGHIERLMGTFANWVRELPGTTFSSVKERGEYDSEGKSVLTLRELEKYVVRRICEKYNKDEHRGLKNKLSPLRAWEQGVLGGLGKKGIGMPPRYANPQKVRIDFLPYFNRVINRSGITYGNIPYQADILRQKLATVHPHAPIEQRKALFRHDPRDISNVWLWDDDSQGYFAIPLAERSLPAMSYGEFKALERVLKARNEPYDPVSIAQHDLENKKLLEDARTATKSKRKWAERRKTNKRKAVKSVETPNSENRLNSDLPAPSLETNFFDDEVVPFDQDVEL